MRKHFYIFLFPLFLLTSCQQNKKSDICINYEYKKSGNSYLFYDIKAENILNKINNKEDFILYSFSSDCYHCNLTSQNLNKIIQEKYFTIYRYSPLNKDYHLLNNYNNSLFPLEIKTPRLLVFKDGELNLEINQSRLGTFKLINGTLTKSVSTSIFYSLKSLSTFKKFSSDFLNFNIFIYKDFDFNLINEDYFHTIKNKCKEMESVTLLLNEYEIEDELKRYLYSYLENNNYQQNYIQINGDKIKNYPIIRDNFQNILDNIS